MLEKISSLQNPKIKNVVRLQEKSQERKKQNLLVMEGARELGFALEAGFEVVQFFFVPHLYRPISGVDASESYEITEEVFAKIAYRENADGFVALLKPKYFELNHLEKIINPFILVLEAVEKPGNLGAILRTADAAAVDAVIVCDPRCDVYNPNVIRSSVGCVFTVPTIVTDNDSCYDFLKKNNVNVYSAALTATDIYTNVDFKHSSAIVMGTEATGLSDFWLRDEISQIKIPMQGQIDSLNVATCTAILTFEAMRQRRT
jgi:TrmH family RNA methyltransferase